ncbi:hypothetical protein PG996_013200 [Apiospora saccharicola]|uniref:Uncharacterized protein n=1 Tax=Apiospora saccharicola TaxID=335842 RepID=A0ABR1U7L3_9PEZI
MLGLFASTLALAVASLVSAGSSSNGDQTDPNLIVHTRTGTFVGDYNDTYPDVRHSTLVDPSQPPLSFQSQPDEKWVFSNYTQRYLDGKVAQIPSIIGTTAREGSALAYVPLSNYTEGPSEETVVKGTVVGELGFGATSTVWLAHDLSQHRHVALAHPPLGESFEGVIRRSSPRRLTPFGVRLAPHWPSTCLLRGGASPDS